MILASDVSAYGHWPCAHVLFLCPSKAKETWGSKSDRHKIQSLRQTCCLMSYASCPHLAHLLRCHFGLKISWTSHSMTEATAVIRDQSGYINVSLKKDMCTRMTQRLLHPSEAQEFDESLQFTGRICGGFLFELSFRLAHSVGGRKSTGSQGLNHLLYRSCILLVQQVAFHLTKVCC